MISPEGKQRALVVILSVIFLHDKNPAKILFLSGLLTRLKSEKRITRREYSAFDRFHYSLTHIWLKKYNLDREAFVINEFVCFSYSMVSERGYQPSSDDTSMQSSRSQSIRRAHDFAWLKLNRRLSELLYYFTQLGDLCGEMDLNDDRRIVAEEFRQRHEQMGLHRYWWRSVTRRIRLNRYQSGWFHSVRYSAFIFPICSIDRVLGGNSDPRSSKLQAIAVNFVGWGWGWGILSISHHEEGE